MVLSSFCVILRPQNRKKSGSDPDFDDGRPTMKWLIAAVLLALSGCASNTEKDDGGSYMSDSRITAEVKTMIFNETGIKAFNVNVTTEGGVVRLAGTVKSRAEMGRVVEAAKRVQGVKAVRNELKVEP